MSTPKLIYTPFPGHGYMVEMFALDPKDSDVDTLTISAAWTRGLAAHPFGKRLRFSPIIHLDS